MERYSRQQFTGIFLGGAVETLRPSKGDRTIEHRIFEIDGIEMAIRTRTAADVGEKDTEVAAINMDIVELHTRNLVAASTHIEVIPTGAVDIDVIEMYVVDRVVGGFAYIERSLCAAPEVARSTFVACGTTAMVDSNIVNIDGAAIGKARTGEVGVDTCAGFQGIGYIEMVGGMVVAAEEAKGRSPPVVLSSTVGESNVAATSGSGPRSHVVVSVVAEGAIADCMSVAAVRAVDAVSIVVAETAVLHQEIGRAGTGIIGNPCPALEMLHPTTTDDAIAPHSAHKAFADLFGVVVVVITAVVDGIEIKSLDKQVAAVCLKATVTIGRSVVGRGSKIDSGVPHTSTDDTCTIGVAQVDTLAAIPCTFGNIDGTSLVVHNKVADISVTVETDFVAAQVGRR